MSAPTGIPSKGWRGSSAVRGLVDVVLAGMFTLMAPALRRFARSRGNLPMASRSADSAGISVIARHYYSPAVAQSDLHKPLDAIRSLPGIAIDAGRHGEFLAGLDYGDELRAIPLHPGSPTEFGYTNGFFEAGDAEMLYNLVRRHKPRRIVEVGSGWSTLMARKAIARNTAEDPAYTCDHVCIEPYEAPWLESVGVRVLRQRVELVDLSVFDALGADDILFVDSSHVVRPQGDVLREVQEIYPRLKSGVLVQVHDIFTPRDLPWRWVIGDRRIWGEQYMLEAFLCENKDFEVVCALNWLRNDHPHLLEKACPVLLSQPDAQPGSFWFRRL